MTPATTDAIAATTLSDPRVSEPLQLADQARALRVTRDNKVEAEQLVLALNAAERRAREVLDPICDANHRAWKVATEKRAEVLKPIEDARVYLRRECGAIQRVLDDEARAEARRKADEAAAAERKRLQEEAERTADAGHVETALEILDEVAAVQPPPVSTMTVAPEKAVGIAYRDNWKFEYVDAKGRPTQKPDIALIPQQYHVVDAVALGQVVRAMKDRTSIPGIRVFNDRQPVGTAGRR